MKRLVSLILVICLCLPLIPIRAEARTTIVKPSGAEGRDFSIAYASKLDNIFQGTAALFSNSTDKYALGQSMRNGKSYAVANIISGYQCYIYANAVYYYLFGDIPYHGSGIGDYWKDSKTVITNQASASYTSFKNAGVDFGAYIRTTGNKNGFFSGSVGHSMIVLRYDSSTITFLEGNADGKGLVRITQETWTEFNSSKLSGRNRRICHIVQPESVTKTPSAAGLSLNKTVGKTGENFTFTFSSDAPCVYDISVIDADTGACVVREESTSATYKRSFQKAGHYTARVTARNSNGSKESAPVEFWVFGAPPVSASFQANQTTIALGDTVTLSSRSDAEYVRFSASMFLYNDSNDGTKVFSEEVPATFIYEPAEPGVYKGNVTAWTHEGRAVSNWVTFYVGKYTVKYDTNGGSGTPAPQTKYYGRDITLTAEKPSRKNHHFLGWAASPTAASAAYQPGAAFAENADTTLYAVWKHICADGHLCDSYSLTKAPTAAAAGALTGPCPKCGETATVTMPKLNTADYEFRVTTPPPAPPVAWAAIPGKTRPMAATASICALRRPATATANGA